MLADVVVADFSRILAGPLCTQVLADLGADVIKVERPDGGDDTRGWGPSYFLGLNRGKRSVTLDLKDPEDVDVARELIRRADVVVESFRPGVMARLGLEPSLNPEAVWCSITAFGERDLPGYDLLLQAVSGLMHVTGEPDGPPLKVGAALIDLVCGLHAAIGVLAALKAGRGGRFEVTLMDSALVSLLNQGSACLNDGVSPQRMGNRHPAVAPYETFEASDATFVVACGNDAMFARMCAELGLGDLAARFPTNVARLGARDEIGDVLAAVFAGAPAETWIDRLNAVGVPAGRVNDVPQAFAFAESLGLEPVWKLGDARTVRSPLRGLAAPSTPPPALGEHSEEIRRWLA